MATAAATIQSSGVFTPATLVDDSQVSIATGNQVYEPRNYHDSYNGEVTARYALALSLNNATVRIGQEVGFDKVAALAKAAGITSVQSDSGDRPRRLRRNSAGNGRAPTPSLATRARISLPSW